MEKVIKWQGNTICDLCGKQVCHKIYDTHVNTFRGIIWANICSACYTVYGIGKAETFVWNDDYSAFIKIKQVSDKTQANDCLMYC